MSTANQDIKTEAKQAGIYLYQIADHLGVSESTMTKRIRREFSAQDKRAIRTIITDLSAKK